MSTRHDDAGIKDAGIDVAALAQRDIDPARAADLQARLETATTAPGRVSTRIARLRTATRIWAPRLAGTLGALAVTALAMAAPAEAALETTRPHEPVHQGPSITSEPGIEIDHVIDQLTEQLAELLAAIGDEPPQLTIDDLEKYIYYSFYTDSSAYRSAGPVEDRTAWLTDETDEQLTYAMTGADYITSGMSLAKAWVRTVAARGHTVAWNHDEPLDDEDAIDAALQAGDLDTFRQLLFSGISGGEALRTRGLARLIAVSLDSGHTDYRHMWLEMIHQTREGVPVSRVTDEPTTIASRDHFLDTGAKEQHEHGYSATGMALLDAWVTRACAMRTIEQLTEQIEVLSSLKAQRVHIRPQHSNAPGRHQAAYY